MRSVLLPIVGLFLGSSLSVQGPPPRDAPASQTGTASLSGRVVAGDTGAPIREATVTISGRNLSASRTVSTDADGRYALTNLPAGQYRLAVRPSGNRAGYLALGGPRGDLLASVVELANGEKRSGFDVALPKAGAIYGRVVDEFGEPLSEVRVEALRRGPAGFGRSLGFSGASTDDRGRFRAFGLEPGDYYLKASLLGGGRLSTAETGEGYLPTYYPATTDLAEAVVVPLAGGQEYGEVEIRLVRSRTFHLAGIVLGLDGSPTASATVTVAQRTEGGTIGQGHSVDSDGTFVVSQLTPGTYTVVAAQTGRFEGPTSAPRVIVIANADVENLALALTEGVSLNGQIVTEDGAVPAFSPRDLRMTVVPGPPLVRSGPPVYGAVKDDWTFEIPGVRGPVLVRTVGFAAPGWRLKTVRYRGADISDEPVEFKQPTSPRDLQVVLGNRGAVLSGLVTDAAGRPVPHAWVLLFPAEPEGRSSASLRFRSGGADKDGHYTNPVLPPGDYLVLAFVAPFPFDGGDARAFDRLVPKARRVTLQADETKTLDLTVADLSK